jgi:glycosyltransferase involved in cell wall biosynthesis
VYHNVTPAEWLWEHQPHIATLCALGREHLPRWARAVDVAAAVSEFNAGELRAAGARDPRVVPIVFHPQRIAAPSGTAADGVRVLSVGRLAPHKRPDLVLQAFDFFRAACAPRAHLDLVGEPLSPVYEAQLRELAGDGVTIHGRIEQARLNELWRDADVLVTLSAHEGFCVPLLEAFASDTPVIARPIGGMREVGGNAVLWTADRDLAVVAELIDLAVRDDELRGELVKRGHARLEEYSAEHAIAALRGAVDAALA